MNFLKSLAMNAVVAICFVQTASGPSFAQERVDEAPPKAVLAETDQADPGLLRENENSQINGSELEPTAASGDQKNSELDDYEASEQISEDLSVSFPVDI
ncbi:MAG: hypothetical protein AAF662_05600 [Pseudomonadota bacterium]